MPTGLFYGHCRSLAIFDRIHHSLAQIKELLDGRPPAPRPTPAHEGTYRERVKSCYAEDAAYYIDLAGETTEVVLGRTELKATRSSRRRKVRPEYREWVQAGQELKRIKLKTLRTGVDKYPCIILLGDPGSGKTTALENLAYQFAGEPDRLPLPLRLSEFGPGMTVEDFIFLISISRISIG